MTPPLPVVSALAADNFIVVRNAATGEEQLPMDQRTDETREMKQRTSALPTPSKSMNDDL